MFFVMDVLDMAGWWSGAIGFQIALGALLFLWNRSRSKKVISKKPQPLDEQRLQDWKPLPLVEEDLVPDKPLIMGKLSEDVCNIGATSFLGLDREAKVRDSSIAALRKYGVGSCGPRGFYGTIDVHLELEERLAKFMGTEEACVYSYGFSTVASAIPAYAKKGDLVFVDECVNFAIQKGLDASRSNINYYRHNDMEHLEELLITFQSKILKRRSFLVTEGIFYNTGNMCPLPKLVELRKKYKLRFILDESLTIGVMGAKGRGLTEHFQIPISEVDLIIGSLENSFATIGGFCVGSSFIVEHQRLSGLGYCFSASLPPLLTQGAISALDLIESDPSLMATLRKTSKQLHRALSSLNYRLGGEEVSPIKHLYVGGKELSLAKKQSCLRQVAEYCLEGGVALCVTVYLRHVEHNCPEPSIRIASNNGLTSGDIDKITILLREAHDLLEL